MPNRLPLPEATLAITALNSSVSSSFLPTDTIETIFNQLMVEEWKVDSNFEGYYNTCAPTTCTYTNIRRMDLLYVIATIAGLFGGLVIVLRLLTPVIVRLVNWIVAAWRYLYSCANDQERVRQTGNMYCRFVIKY
ncbi:unnamed protein product [Rotaria sp. Silwood2]|nr:unnamed protein product [Rotaria sp. Silwood2]CAF3451386.1 unnamed protein product [Rotaria sp. Silwood2]CAF4486778.1 unnamed protein product [Rotaria sp. Silwood2]CAF4662128.1 unnamed protein product [Rotaria sp. Silwood2]CAF4753612.1 unnamed protein product [Rotaria sp. Silwood2]